MARLDVAEDDDQDGTQRVYTGEDFNLISKSEEIFDDPFNVTWGDIKKSEGINDNLRRRANRLEKSFTGQKDAKSKKLDPLDLTGYSLFQIVQPPYNMLYLAQLYDVSPYHHSAVNAKAANVVGLGYKFEETWATKEKVESAMSTPKKLDKLRSKLEEAKEDLRNYIESMNSDDSFLENMKKVFIDLESTGNAYLEVGRTATGQVGYLGHIPTTTMRIRRHRDGFVQVVYNRYTFFRNFGDTERLIFGARIPADEYLARYRVCDLFLDTAPYNAGTTASDALWVGLPVLTLLGSSFAGRMAASLLNAIDLPELITCSQEEYEQLAIELASNPNRLAEIKYRLIQNRLSSPLFNTPFFTKNLETAYVKIYEKYLQLLDFNNNNIKMLLKCTIN